MSDVIRSVGVSEFVVATPRPTPPHYDNTMDSSTIAGGGGDVIVAPEELDKFAASLQEYLDQLTAQVAYNSAQLSRQNDVMIIGPQIRGVARAVSTAAETSEQLMRTLMIFQLALDHDVAAVQAARQSYVGTDESAAQDITLAGGA